MTWSPDNLRAEQREERRLIALFGATMLASFLIGWAVTSVFTAVNAARIEAEQARGQ